MSEKAYRVSVVLLLVFILGVQLFGQLYKPQPTEKCLTAIEEATTANNLVRSSLVTVDSLYDSEVYDRADNINQQIFLSNEQVFKALIYITRAEQATLDMQIACR